MASTNSSNIYYMKLFSNYSTIELNNLIINSSKLLIVQDIDGVCIPLVKDPLKRKIEIKYVQSISTLKNEFKVLTCGEHEGERGVNRIIEKAFKTQGKNKSDCYYLPGLAACGIEYQNNRGEVELLGINKSEIDFLRKSTDLMRSLLKEELKEFFPNLCELDISKQVEIAICNTRFSPAINLNNLFLLVKDDILKKQRLQDLMKRVMNQIIDFSIKDGLKDSFYLHISPNIGKKEDGSEILKYATEGDIGSTDIQLIVNGAFKEAGLLVLLNKYIKDQTGNSPFGDKFNVRTAPKSMKELIKLCKNNISPENMPLLIGVGDTVTSKEVERTKTWSRGGSDRGFLTLIQELGKAYSQENIIIFVDSSHGEVNRPSFNKTGLDGISDKSDILKFNIIMNNGPEEYISWIMGIAKRRLAFLDSQKILYMHK